MALLLYKTPLTHCTHSSVSAGGLACGRLGSREYRSPGSRHTHMLQKPSVSFFLPQQPHTLYFQICSGCLASDSDAWAGHSPGLSGRGWHISAPGVREGSLQAPLQSPGVFLPKQVTREPMQGLDPGREGSSALDLKAGDIKEAHPKPWSTLPPDQVGRAVNRETEPGNG